MGKKGPGKKAGQDATTDQLLKKLVVSVIVIMLIDYQEPFHLNFSPYRKSHGKMSWGGIGEFG